MYTTHPSLVMSDRYETKQDREQKGGDTSLINSLSGLNRMLGPAERTSLLNLINYDQEDVRVLSERIQSREKRTNLTAKRVQDTQDGITMLEVLQRSVQRRIDDNLDRSTYLLDGKKNIRLNVTADDIKERSTAQKLQEIIEIYKQEEASSKEALQKDRELLESVLSLSRTLSRTLLEESMCLSQETRTLGSLKSCRDQVLVGISDKNRRLSTAHYIPDEVLATIFHLVLEDAIDSVYMDVDCPQDFTALRLSWTILENVKSVEIIGRNTGGQVDIGGQGECQIKAESYTIRQIRPTFKNDVAANLIDLEIFIPEIAADSLSLMLGPLVNLLRLTLNISGRSVSGLMSSNVVKLPRLEAFSSSTRVSFQVLDRLIVASSLVSLTVDEHCNPNPSGITLKNWNYLITQKGLDQRLSRLNLGNIGSEEYTRTEILPKLAILTQVQTLNLQGAHLGPILMSMTADPTTLPNVQELALEETDIDGHIIQKLLSSRESSTDQGEIRRRLRKLVLDHCRGIDRAFCESVRGNVDELAIYC
ncbi:hypothetical protein CPB86DRAFT_829410 [Serendipita vermifera]|nr:hypothetical protein CPB86DRAFT_829410 [Serendipita vermifera]